MKVYKIKHKPTGLYFTPSKGYGNLSVNGKLYSKKPLYNWYEGPIKIIMKKWQNEKLNKKEKIIIDYFNLERNSKGHFWIDECINVPRDDWKIEEM